MQKWEYTVLVTEKPIIAEMNEMGSHGWEIFHMERFGELRSVFAKRPLNAPGRD